MVISIPITTSFYLFITTLYCTIRYFSLTEVIDASTGELVNYNTGLSVVSTRKRLLLPQEAELVIAHGMYS